MPGIAAVLAACLIPSAIMLIPYDKLMENYRESLALVGKKTGN